MYLKRMNYSFSFGVLVFCVFLSSFARLHARAERDKKTELPIVLVITSYNNSKWYCKNLDSIFNQNYSNYRIVYIDDCSTDGTGDLVGQYIRQMGQQDRVTLIKNKERKLKMENFYNAIHNYCHDKEIVMDLDGDDWLAHDNVLSIINKVYSDQDIWISYGSYVCWPKPTRCCCAPISKRVMRNNAYRRNRWVTSHLRTFYAWLFKKINSQDFMYKGQYVDMAADVAYMFPMLEMSGGRVKFVSEVLYIYNRATPINDDKKDIVRQRFLDGIIRNKPRYDKIAGSGDFCGRRKV